MPSELTPAGDRAEKISVLWFNHHQVYELYIQTFKLMYRRESVTITEQLKHCLVKSVWIHWNTELQFTFCSEHLLQSSYRCSHLTGVVRPSESLYVWSEVSLMQSHKHSGFWGKRLFSTLWPRGAVQSKPFKQWTWGSSVTRRRYWGEKYILIVAPWDGWWVPHCCRTCCSPGQF